MRLTVLPKIVLPRMLFFLVAVTTIQRSIDLHTFDFSTHLYIITSPFRSKTEIQFRFEKWTLKSHEISQRLCCHIFHKFALEKKYIHAANALSLSLSAALTFHAAQTKAASQMSITVCFLHIITPS